MQKPIIVIMLLLAAAAGGASAQDLERGLHPLYSYTASGYGMGNAVSSLPAHPSNIWVNPSGLAHMEGYHFYAAPHDEVNGVSDNARDRIFMAAGLRAGGGVLGTAFILRQRKNVPFPADEETLVPVDINEPAFMISYGRMIRGPYSFGVTLLAYQHRADREELDGDLTGALTLGMMRLWKSNRNDLPLEWRFALSAANLGPSFKVGETDADHPTNFRAGLSTRWEGAENKHFVVSGDFFYLPRGETAVEGKAEPRIGGGVGGELGLAGIVIVRLGYIWDAESDLSDMTYGFGIGHTIYSHIGGMLDYGHAPAEVDFADHIGVSFYYVP